MAATAISLGRVEADRLIVAVDRNATVAELPEARRLASFARHGELPAEHAALARRCLRAEGNAPELLTRLGALPGTTLRTAPAERVHRMRPLRPAAVYD